MEKEKGLVRQLSHKRRGRKKEVGKKKKRGEKEKGRIEKER
jgi:hypothetical protein